MALPAGRAAMGSFKGKKGDKGATGTLDWADAKTVPAGQPAAVRMVTDLRGTGAEIDVPRGLPSPGGETSDQAFATFIAGLDTQTRAQLMAAVGQRIALPESLTTTPYRAPRKPRPAGFQETFQSGHGWSGLGTGATFIANDTTRHWEGLQCATIVTATTGTAATRLQKAGMALPDMSDKLLRIVMKIDRPDLVNQVNIYIGGAGLVDTFSWRPTIAFKPNEPTELTLPWSSFLGTTGTYTRNADGTPSTRSGFQSIRVEVIPNSTHTVPITWSVQRIEPIPDWSVLFPNGVVSLVTDDGRLDLYDRMRSILRARSLKATHYVICESIGTGAPFMSLTQLKQLQVDGDEVGLHAYAAAVHSGSNDRGFADSTEAGLRTDLARGRAWLLANGFTADSLAYPKGAYSYTTDGKPITDIVAGYFQTARTTGGLASESFPPANLHRVNAVTGVGEAGPVAGTPAALTSANGLLSRARHNRDWLTLVFHQIITGTPTVSEQCSVTGLTQICDHIVSLGIEVLTVREVMQRVVNAMP